MAKKLSRNAPCPCGSGKKYKHCCLGKDFDWMETDDGRIARRVPLSDEVMDIFDGLRESHIARHGVAPERIFEGAPPLELIEHWTVEAMKKSGIEPALIHAFERTNGLLVGAHNESKVPGADVDAWEAAIDEYERTTGKKADRRRLTDEDFEAIMRNGPQEAPQDRFVTRLPLSPPFSKEEWSGKNLSDLVNDRECFDYFRECFAQIKRSGRAETYVRMFCVMTQLGDPPRGREVDYEELAAEALEQDFTVEQWEHALESLVLTCKPKGAMPNAAAAYEFLSVVGDFMSGYALQAGLGDELDESLMKVNGLALLAFGAAVNAELGIKLDIWAP
jgi:hypothetical protein